MIISAGMQQAGGQLPPQILADQKAPPGSDGVPHYYMLPQIFRPCDMPASYYLVVVYSRQNTKQAKADSRPPHARTY